MKLKTILITIIILIIGVLVAGGVYHRKEIGEWFKDNFPTKQTVNELKKENEEKDKQLADKDKEINNFNSQLETVQTNLTTLQSEKAELERQVEELQSAITGNLIITENELEIIPYSNLLGTYIYNDSFSFYYNSSNFEQVMLGNDSVSAVVCNDKYNVEFDNSLLDDCLEFVHFECKGFDYSEYNFVSGYQIFYHLYDYNGNELNLSSCPDGFYLQFERIQKSIDGENFAIHVYAYLNEDRTIFLNNFSSTDLTTLTGEYFSSDGGWILNFDNLRMYNSVNSFLITGVYNNYISKVWSDGASATDLYISCISDDVLLADWGVYLLYFVKGD